MKSSLLLSKPPQSVSKPPQSLSKPPSTGVRAAPDPTLDRDLVELLDRAAETFAILAGPVRLRILHAVCDGERPVSEIVSIVGQSQTNVSQHLALMYRAGVLRRRRNGAQVFYGIADPKVVSVCRLMCTMVASENDEVGVEREPTPRRRGRQPGAIRNAREPR